MRRLRKTRKQIQEVISLTTDLFGYINYDLTELGITKDVLNFYFISKYSNRWISPVLELLMSDDDEISDADFEVLGQYLNQLYKNKWDRLKDILLLEYDPIHNYSDTMSEEITDNDDKVTSVESEGTNSNTRTDNLIKTNNLTRTNDLTRTDNLSETTEYEGTRNGETESTNENSLYGFNSDNPVPSDSSEGSGSNTWTDSKEETVENSGTVKNTGTVKDTGTVTNTGTSGNSGTNSSESTESSERDYTRERTVTHIGNIGNLSTQNLLGQEVDFWQWNFIIQMLSDVADVITLPIY